jgi:hypothetical protein
MKFVASKRVSTIGKQQSTHFNITGFRCYLEMVKFAGFEVNLSDLHGELFRLPN